MFSYGSASQAKLATCHTVMRQVMEAALALSIVDITILVGWRGEADQNAAVAAGNSKTPWPTSKHNHVDAAGNPQSLAVDFAPWYDDEPHIRWDKGLEFAYLAGLIMGVGTPIAHAAGFRLRYGGDFNRNGDVTDDDFKDNDHVELEPL